MIVFFISDTIKAIKENLKVNYNMKVQHINGKIELITYKGRYVIANGNI